MGKKEIFAKWGVNNDNTAVLLPTNGRNIQPGICWVFSWKLKTTLHIYHTKLKHYLLDKPHWPKMSIYTNLNNQSTFVSKLELSIILHIEENAYFPLKHFTALLKTNTRHQILQASLSCNLSGRKGKRIFRCYYSSNSMPCRGNCLESKFNVYVNVLHKIKNDNCQSWKWRTYFV